MPQTLLFAQRVNSNRNKEAISIKDWVTLCYQVAGKEAEFVNVHKEIEQRNYFSFYDYEYYLGVKAQLEFMQETEPLEKGLQEAFEWYRENAEQVVKKGYLEFIDEKLGDSL